jgi:hypothetical protein
VDALTALEGSTNQDDCRANIRTRLGIVKVRWMDVAGDRCWQTSGILEAKKLVAPAIERIEQFVESH